MRIRYDKRALRRLRTAQGLDIVSLAEKSRCTKQNISLIERGLVVPKVSTLAKLAEALSVEPASFFQVEA